MVTVPPPFNTLVKHPGKITYLILSLLIGLASGSSGFLPGVPPALCLRWLLYPPL